MLSKKNKKERVYSQNEVELIEAFKSAFQDVLDVYSEYVKANNQDKDIFKILNYFHETRNKILDGSIDFEKEFQKNPFLETLLNQKLLLKLKQLSSKNINIDSLIELNKMNMEKQYDSFVSNNFKKIKSVKF